MDKKQKKICLVCNSRLKIKKCSNCGGNRCFFVKDGKEYLLGKEIVEKIHEIFLSNQNVYEKKIALFNLLESLDLGELPKIDNQRINYLLKSRFYNELAKKSMEEYEKSTINDFSK